MVCSKIVLHSLGQVASLSISFHLNLFVFITLVHILLSRNLIVTAFLVFFLLRFSLG